MTDARKLAERIVSIVIDDVVWSLPEQPCPTDEQRKDAIGLVMDTLLSQPAGDVGEEDDNVHAAMNPTGNDEDDLELALRLYLNRYVQAPIRFVDGASPAHFARYLLEIKSLLVSSRIAGDVSPGLREELARIIDPSAWKNVHGAWISLIVCNGRPIDVRQVHSLEKADAIIALLNSKYRILEREG